MNKLIVVIMGPGKEHFAEMCLDSVKDADDVFYWTNNVKNIPIIKKPNLFGIIDNEWDETDPATNGKCRQRYLEHLKENYPDDWCLCLDEDELVEDLQKIRDFINDKDRQDGIYNVKMRHFIGDLGHEDAVMLVHVVPGRLFKISEAIKYPEHSHPVLEGKLMGACLDTTIWHLGHLPVEYMDYILKRYKQHSNDSIIHNPEFLEQWKMSHLFGQYPKREINPVELPKQICDRYEINKDEFYHSRYQLELKHPEMVFQWNKYFRPSSVLDLGCGRGCYLRYWEQLVDRCEGIELSSFAIDNRFCKTEICNADIRKYSNFQMFDLITFIDVLEHLEYKELDNVLKIFSKEGNKFLFSIPFLGDPNLESDNTHIIKEDKNWWVNKLSEYFIIKDAPNDWLYHEQLLIGEKK